jgi:hypothetical protein
VRDRSWPGQVEASPRLGAGNLSFSCSPRPRLGARGDRPHLAVSVSSIRSEAVIGPRWSVLARLTHDTRVISRMTGWMMGRLSLKALLHR